MEKLVTKKVDFEIFSEATIHRVLSRILALVVLLFCTSKLTGSVITEYSFFLLSSTKAALDTTAPLFYVNELETYLVPDFRNVTTIGDIWNYIRYNFLYVIHDPNVSNHTFNTIYGTGILVGKPRMRQLRVKKEKCMHTVQITRFREKSCYPVYSMEKEFKGHFRDLAYTTDANKIFSALYTYAGGGFTIDFKPAFPRNRILVEDLYYTRWIDAATRLFVVEFSIFYDGPPMFLVVKLIFEIEPTGLVTTSKALRCIPLTCFMNRDTFTIISWIAFYVLIFYYTYLEVYEIRVAGWRTYTTSFYNYPDIITELTAYLVLAYDIWHILEVRSIERMCADHQERYINMDDLATLWRVYIPVVGFLNLAVWLKLLRLVSFNRTIRQLAAVMRMSFHNFVGYIIIYVIVIYAFALCGSVSFADQVPAWIEVSSCITELMRFILSDTSYYTFADAHGVMAPVFFVCVIMATLMCLDFFVAIYLNFDLYVTKHVEINDSLVVKMLYQGVKSYVCFWRKRDKTEMHLETELAGSSSSTDAEEKEVRRKREEPIFREGTIENLRVQLAKMNERANVLEAKIEQFVEATGRIEELHKNETYGIHR